MEKDRTRDAAQTQLPRWDGPLTHPFYSKVLKRCLDFALAVVFLLPCLAVMLPIAIAVKCTSEGPVFYRALRGGYHNRPFSILKFRTMVVGADQYASTTALDDPRVTRVGRVLRRSKLDELPQLWNIFVGDMAVIGPRPALWNQYDLLAERDKYHANDVRPGLTGWAQIHGRDELEIAEKAKLDGWYVEHLSFGLDVKCFFGTIAAVLKHDGVVEGGTGTLHEETGKENH